MKNAACLVQKHLSESMPVSGLADVPENPCSLEVRGREALVLPAEVSQNEWTFRIVGNLGADVLDPPLPFRSQKVEA
jgi:hypothetical protein